MINLKLVKENPDLLKNSLAKRNFQFDLDHLLKIDAEYRKINLGIEKLNKKRNELSKEIQNFIIAKKLKEAEEIKVEVTKLNKTITLETKIMTELKDELDQLLLTIPNILNEKVPLGVDENDNVEVEKRFDPPKFNFAPKSHWDLGKIKNILDLEKSSTLAGSRFSIYKNKGAKLIRALQSFTLDQHQLAGYEEYILPLMLNEKSLLTTGQLPKFQDDFFQLKFRDYYLSPTLEVQLVNLFRNEIIDEKLLPIKITSSSYNFRSEAGAAGRDLKGVLRQHQFIKTELVNLCKPKDSYPLLEAMKKQACSILDLLEIPYRVVKLCSGDIGFGATFTYDIEVWMPSYQAYREISSCSNCEDFQARRGLIRYNDAKTNEKILVHTLNGTGVSMDRLWAAIIENNQQANGEIFIPKALKKYLDFEKI
ncbi:MAG: serine--tRNA ligase [Mycoplasmoidaceae bacterium]